MLNKNYIIISTTDYFGVFILSQHVGNMEIRLQNK